MQEFRIVFDTSEAETQAHELSQLLETDANDLLGSDGLLDDLVESILRLPFNVILRDGGTAIGTDGILEKRFFIRGDSLFDSLLAALRAGKWNEFVIAHSISDEKL